MSTSSSERRLGPWASAGVCAGALLLLADALFFRWAQPWEFFDGRVEWMYQRVIQDRIALRDLDRVAGDDARVFVFGTSRAEFDFRPELVPELVPDGVHFVRLAHFRMFPPEIRSAVDAIRQREPAAVVIGLSEIDTHAPLQLDQRSSFRSLRAIFEIAQVLGPGYALDQREVALRIALGNALETYRYRDLLGSAGLEGLRRFAGARPPAWHRQAETPLTPLQRGVLDRVIQARSIAAGGPEDLVADREKNAKIWGQALMLGTTASGPHTEAQRALLRRSVEVLRGIGSEVLIAELPVHPEARPLFPGEFRAAFLEFTRELERDYGSRTLRLDEQPEYRAEDFSDLTHLDAGGARKFTRATLAALGRPAPPGR